MYLNRLQLCRHKSVVDVLVAITQTILTTALAFPPIGHYTKLRACGGKTKLSTQKKCFELYEYLDRNNIQILLNIGIENIK